VSDGYGIVKFSSPVLPERIVIFSLCGFLQPNCRTGELGSNVFMKKVGSLGTVISHVDDSKKSRLRFKGGPKRKDRE
jgi:hypothetical protein